MKRQASTKLKPAQFQLLARKMTGGHIRVWRRAFADVAVAPDLYTPRELKPFVEGLLQMVNETIEEGK